MKKIKRFIKYRSLELFSYLNSFLRGSFRGKKVIIFAQGRTGSALLETKHKKVVSKKVSDIVVIFDELKEVLIKNNWLHYIENEL